MSSAKIGELNDQFRKHGIGNGRIVVTRSVRELGPEFELAALHQVRAFDAFTPGNDPYGEHDFGSFELQGHTVFWKIEYYDLTCTQGSEDPSDPLQTYRVLIIMWLRTTEAPQALARACLFFVRETNQLSRESCNESAHGILATPERALHVTNLSR